MTVPLFCFIISKKGKDFLKKMNQISTEQYKKIATEIMIYIDKLCRKNNITYYLAYGTLLGAVRHGGFIPWDDDIDIIMDRENFNRFCDAVKEDNNKVYKLMWLTESRDYDLPLPKMIDTRTELIQDGRKSSIKLGVWVDIIIMDDIPDNPKKQKYILKKFDFYQRCWNFSQYTCYSKKISNLKELLYDSFMKILTLPGSRFWANKLNNAAQKYNGKGYKSYAELTFAVGKHKAWKKRWLGTGSEINFDNNKFFAPENHHEYLTYAYGNYMELPPEEKRICHHHYSVYYKN